MNYFFFDIECCDGRHICTFGYVLTDENFNIIKKKDIIINPRRPFCTGKVKLAYKIDIFKRAQEFPQFYDEIFSLLTKKDQMIIGHSISDDFNYLRRACERYKLELPNFEFFDSQILFAHLTNEPNSRKKLKEITELLEITHELRSHKSDDDADMVKEIVQKLCLNQKKTTKELFGECLQTKGKVIDGVVYVHEDEPKRIFNAFFRQQSPIGSIGRCCVLAEPNKNDKGNRDSFFKKVDKKHPLNGRNFCFSESFKDTNLFKMWGLVDIAQKNGAKFDNDSKLPRGILVWDGNQNCKKYVNIKTKNKRNPILTPEEFSKMCDVEWKEIKEKDRPESLRPIKMKLEEKNNNRKINPRREHKKKPV
ncbi:MAG: exonuclease domain-containing protein [Firmicutes bacterium]|nr:exonuclease domain-containing protein [Bacillota bacterium]MCL2256199.1 exonuclease domain-containing protein [Bacillota bacterium]